MNEIVNKVLETEDDVKAMLDAARKQASDMIQQTDREIESQLSEARETARINLKTRVENTQKLMETKKKTFFEELKKTDSLQSEQVKAKIETITKELLTIIASTGTLSEPPDDRLD